MITEKQIRKILELQIIQDKLNRMNKYYVTVDFVNMSYSQAREAILLLKFSTGAEIDFDDLDMDVCNEIGVIAG